MACPSRVTDDMYTQYFGNNRNRFYLEFRCNRPCFKDMPTCIKCAEKSQTSIQTSRKFNHGMVWDPIPEGSHLYGGRWYQEGIKKWGEPSSDIMEFALQHQNDARKGVTMVLPLVPEVLPQVQSAAKPPLAKKSKKPKLAKLVVEETPVVPSPKPTLRKKTPYVALPPPSPICKEVVLPTHIENTLEELNADEYEVEYIKLSPFEWESVPYYRDSKKNKLYRKTKDRIDYVGRFDPQTESIHDVPDSDQET